MRVLGRWRAGDAKHPDAMHVAEAVLGFLERRHRLERDVYAAAINLECQRLTGAGADDLLHVGKALDRAPVDREHQVARLEAGRLGGAAGLHGVDARRRARLPKDHEESRENDDGQYEIRHRTGHDYGRPRPHRLMDEAMPTVFLAHRGERRLVGDACRVVVAEEFYISSKWNSGELPPGPAPIIEAKQLRSESDGEDKDPDATPARNQEMPELVEEHHECQDEQEGDEISEHAAT